MTPVERILGLIGQKCFDSYVYFSTFLLEVLSVLRRGERRTTCNFTMPRSLESILRNTLV